METEDVAEEAIDVMLPKFDELYEQIKQRLYGLIAEANKSNIETFKKIMKAKLTYDGSGSSPGYKLNG